ncbi:MAG: hypothetical protein HY329_14455 [Chloroflexi bacterium]|nr:hypothetical protein [Chloroflexota bacterium]
MGSDVERVIRLLEEHRQDVAAVGAAGRVMVMDSLTFCDWRNNSGDVLVGASFCGAVAAAFAASVNARGMIACEAGVGKDNAGIDALPFLDTRGVPCAAAATMSARLADGQDLYQNGVVSIANETAKALGIVPGLTVREAAQRMLEYRRNPPPIDRTRTILHTGKNGRVVAMASASFADETNRNDVICAGSHGGFTGAGYALWLRPRGLIANDGGFAKDDSGIGALPLFDEVGVPAAAVDTLTARLGDGRSAYEEGVISAVNGQAQALGIQPGMMAREAARRMLGE